MTHLEDLSLAEFTDELLECLWDDDKFDPFLAEEVVDTTLEVLTNQRTKIRGKLLQYSADDPDWRRRALRFANQLDGRYSVAVRVIRNLNHAESAERDAQLRRWGDFAYHLAEALSQSDNHQALDTIFRGDDLPARRWMELRREQMILKGRLPA